jgi:NAD-dependent SIR2 family protein deacetylase
MDIEQNLSKAVEWLREADSLLITAGAGMGIDSGLPDYRGQDGFWRAYPALRSQNMSFERMASGNLFKVSPELAWGFYGHRLNLYRRTEPHRGFNILKRWGSRTARGVFVFTSNVDGHFQKSGLSEEQVFECHGTVNVLQCSHGCASSLWTAEGFEPEVDEEHCRLISPIPLCPTCGRAARPNVLMFDDRNWIGTRSSMQEKRLLAWQSTVERLVVVEIGAGQAIPTVRRRSEANGPCIIRINPTDYEIASHLGVALPGGALDQLSALDGLLQN